MVVSSGAIAAESDEFGQCALPPPGREASVPCCGRISDCADISSWAAAPAASQDGTLSMGESASPTASGDASLGHQTDKLDRKLTVSEARL